MALIYVYYNTNLNRNLKNKYNIFGISRNMDNDKNIYTYGQLKSISNNVDVIIHLAGIAHDSKNYYNERDYINVNMKLAIKIFKLFLQSSASTFIFLSSVKAVADICNGILYEDHFPDPKTYYGQSKLNAEIKMIKNKLPEGKRLFILRPCMIHGAGNKGNLNLLYKFLNKGFPYPLGQFKNQRSFLSIDNFIYIIDKIISDNTISGGIYNLSDDEFLSTTDLINLISHNSLNISPKILYINKKIIFLLTKIGDFIPLPINTIILKKLTQDYMVSNNKIKKVLQINKLPMSTHEGIIKTIEGFE